MNAVQALFQSVVLEASWAERVGWVLLHSLWQIALIAGLYAVVSATLRKRSAQGRYVLGCAAMLAMVAAPLATWLLLPGGGNPQAEERGALATGGGTVDASPGGSAMETVAPRLVEDADVPPAVVPVPERAPALVDPVEDPPAPIISSDLLRPWMPWATAAWLLGVCLLSMRPILGWLHIRRLQRHGLSPLSGSMGREAERLARRLGVARTVRFLKSKLVEVPTVVGSLRPFVLLPASAVSGLSVAEIEMILAHELAHIRRHDYLVNLLQTVLEALLFFHPAMWWVSRQVRRERENCCDDIAVEVSGNRDSYVRALTHLEEQRGSSHVAVLTATGGSLLGRVRRLLGQPGSEFGYRSLTAWLAGLVAVGLVSLALATGNASQNECKKVDSDEVGREETAPVPVEHEAVMVVRAFLEAIESVDYDRAVGLTIRTALKREGLAEVANSYDLSKADIAKALVGGASAAVLTQRLAGSEAAKPGQFGFHLVRERDRWRIRDVDFLPDDPAAREWLADFRRLEPWARPVDEERPPADERPAREVMLAHAHALESGDWKTLEQTWEFQDDLDRRFGRRMAGMFARAEEMRVELVSMQPMGDESLFACFLMRDGPEDIAKQPTPRFVTFHRKDGKWRCAPPQDLRTIVRVRTMGAAQMGRRAITQQMIALRFGPQDRGERIASRKAQADSFARLARPPYGMTGMAKIAEQMQVAIEREKKTAGRSWQELWRLTLEELGKDALPRPDDFHLSFYLQADPDDPHARRLPFPGREKTFLAEPFPCLTDEALLEAGVESVPGSNHPQMAIRLTRGGARLLAAITRQSVRKRLAIVVDGKVVWAPEIMTEIAGGRLTVTGDFSRQEIEAMVEKLNSCREKAEEFLEGLGGTRDPGNQESESQEAVNRMVQSLLGLRHKHPELARFAEDLRHEVQVRNGALIVSLAYDHNHDTGTKARPSGSKEDNKAWCRISLDIRPPNSEPTQRKSIPVDAHLAIRWNGKSDSRSYRLGNPPLIAAVSVETGSEALRRDVNRIIDRELSTLIAEVGTEPGGGPAGGVGGENPDNPLGLDNGTLIRLFHTGKTLRDAARESVAYRTKHGKVPGSAEVLFEDCQQFAKDMIVDPFAAEGGVVRITRRRAGPDEHWLQVWSVGPDGDWDGGKPIDSSDPALDGDLGAEMRIGKWAFHWLADETMAMHLDGKRLSHYLAARGPEYPGAIDPHQTLAWGPVVDGLRVAVKLLPEKESYAPGEKIGLEFHVRNVSRHPITIAGFSWRQDAGPDSFVIRNDQGEKLEVGHSWFSGFTPIQRETLKTGRVAVFKSSALTFLAEGMPDPEHPVGHTVLTTPGRHTLQFELIFPDGGSSGPDGMPRPTDWQGTLRTGVVTVMVSDQDSKVEGRKNKGVEDKDAIWGETVEGIRSRLRPGVFRSGLQCLNFDLRNESDRLSIQLAQGGIPQEILVDGVPYRWAGAGGIADALPVCKPGQRVTGAELKLGREWKAIKTVGGPDLLELKRGKHTVQAVVHAVDRNVPGRRPALRILSNPLEVVVPVGKRDDEAAGAGVVEVPGFVGTTAITFHNDLRGDRFVEVTKSDEVRELIAAIKLTPKEPCLCEHIWSATFHKKHKTTKVSVCDHCFDIQGDEPAKHFQMPPGFFRLFAKHTGWPEEAGNDDVPGPARDEPDRPAGEPGGEVRVRLHSPQARWDDGRWTLFFKTDLESATQRVLPHYGAPIEEFFVELDGEWFEEKDRGASVARSVAPSPAKRRQNLHTRLCAREWRSMVTGLPMPEFTPGRHTVRIGFPLADEPDATGQRPRAVSNPVEVATATKEVGEAAIELRKCLAKIVKRIGELKGRYRELEGLDGVELGGAIVSSRKNPLHLGFQYNHKFAGWDGNKQPRIGEGGCHVGVWLVSPENPDAMATTVPLPRFGELEARCIVVVGEGERAGEFREAVMEVIGEELENLRNGSPGAWGKPSDGVRARIAGVERIWGRSDWGHPVMRLRYDVKNEGRHILHLPENGLDHQVEVDGQWYEWVDPPRAVTEPGAVDVSPRGGKQLEFGPQAKHGGRFIEVAGNWHAIPKGKESDYAARWYAGWAGGRDDDSGRELVLTPGRHQVRVAVVCPSARAPFHGVVRSVSNPVDVQIGQVKLFEHPNSKHDGVIRGRIIDPQPAAPAPEYHVMLWQESWETNTGEAPALVVGAGESFEFRNLPPGNYEIRAREWRPRGRVVNWNTDWTFIKAEAAVTEGKAAKVELVFGRDDTGRWSEAHTWGEAVDGVMMCITKSKFTIAPGEELDLRVEIYNGSKTDRRVALEHEAWELEIDGEWLKPAGGVEGLRRFLPLPAKQAQHQVEVWPWLWENMTAAIQELPPGKHTIRVARRLNGEGRSSKNPPQIRIVSQPVTVEVVAGDESTGIVWGKADKHSLALGLSHEDGRRSHKAGEEVVCCLFVRNEAGEVRTVEDHVLLFGHVPAVFDATGRRMVLQHAPVSMRVKRRIIVLKPGERFFLGAVSFKVLAPGTKENQNCSYRLAPGEYRVVQDYRFTIKSSPQMSEANLRSGSLPLTVEGEAAPEIPALPFAELKVVMKCNWWGTLRRELTIRGDGRTTFAMVTHQDETKCRAEFHLSDAQRNSLTQCLEATRWLERPPESTGAVDAVEFAVELSRQGRKTRAEFMVQDEPPYHGLEMFLNGLNRQEELFYQLTEPTKARRHDAARNIQNQLSSRMRRPGHTPAAHLKGIDYTRFVPILIPWLKDRGNHHADEMAAAIDLVGYLKLAEQREAVEALMGLHTYSDWDCVCECLVRLGDPRSIPVLKERALKPGADAACWALIRMGAAAESAICEVLRTPRVPNNNPAYKMIRVYLDHFHELPEPVAPAIVEAIRAARHGQSPISEYADQLLDRINGGHPTLGLRVTIAPQKPEYAPGEPVPVKWKIENTGKEARTILWHPLHYSPVIFSFMQAGGTEYDRADRRRHIVDERPAPPEPLVLQPGESHEANIDLRHFLPDGTSTWVIAGYYWPRAKEAAIPAELLDDPKFAGAMLERIGSAVTRIVVRPRPRTAEEDEREAERLVREAERLHREAEEARRRAMRERE